MDSTHTPQQDQVRPSHLMGVHAVDTPVGGLCDDARMDQTAPATTTDLIDLERMYPGPHNGRKEIAIRTLFGLTPNRYYQRLGGVLDTPELQQIALEHDPVTTNRLMQQRADRRALAS